MYAGKRVIAIASCLNEEGKVGHVVRRIREMQQPIVDEILIMDDGSTDNTAAIARAEGATVISLGAVLGVGIALRRAYAYAVEQGYELIVTIAGNNKDEPNEISDLLRPIVEDGCHFVQGSRFLGKGNFGDMPFYRKIATRLHPVLFSIVVGRWVSESTNGFRAFTDTLLRDPRIDLAQDWLSAYELEPYIYYKAVTLGYRTAEVPCTKIYPPRATGYTKMKPITGWWSILRPLVLLRLGLRK